MAENEKAPDVFEGSGEKEQKRIDLDQFKLIGGAFSDGGGISEEPFQTKPLTDIDDVLKSAQSIANKTGQRVFFKYNSTVASVDKNMDPEFRDDEKEVENLQMIKETALKLKEQGFRAMSPDEIADWQRQMAKEDKSLLNRLSNAISLIGEKLGKH